METKFTEGKWAAKIQPDLEGLVRTINVGSKRIATLSFVGIEESEANARLIESAPEMLDACKTILHNFETNIKYNRTLSVTELNAGINFLNRVIKQATEL